MAAFGFKFTSSSSTPILLYQNVCLTVHITWPTLYFWQCESCKWLWLPYLIWLLGNSESDVKPPLLSVQDLHFSVALTYCFDLTFLLPWFLKSFYITDILFHVFSEEVKDKQMNKWVASICVTFGLCLISLSPNTDYHCIGPPNPHLHLQTHTSMISASELVLSSQPFSTNYPQQPLPIN